jgi:hypothetical protein
VVPRRRCEQALLAVVEQAYVCGCRRGAWTGWSKSLGLRVSNWEVSRVRQALDEHVEAFRTRPLEGRYRYLHLDGRLGKVAAMLEDAEADILAFYAFPAAHRQAALDHPLERFNREVGRRTDVVGIFPDDQSLVRLAGCRRGRPGGRPGTAREERGRPPSRLVSPPWCAVRWGESRRVPLVRAPVQAAWSGPMHHSSARARADSHEDVIGHRLRCRCVEHRRQFNGRWSSRLGAGAGALNSVWWVGASREAARPVPPGSRARFS